MVKLNLHTDIDQQNIELTYISFKKEKENLSRLNHEFRFTFKMFFFKSPKDRKQSPETFLEYRFRISRKSV